MGISPEMRAQYEANRNRMFQADSKLKLYFRGSLILGAVMFLMTFAAGAKASTSETLHGPEKFYGAMDAGAWQILLCLANIGFSFLASMRKRIPSLAQMGINAAVGLYFVLNDKVGLKGAMAVLCTLGVGLTVLAQFAFNQFDDLKTQPGWPHFSPEADAPAEYEVPAYVKRAEAERAKRAAESEMVGISTGPAQLPAVTEAQLGIADMTDARTQTAHAAVSLNGDASAAGALGIAEMDAVTAAPAPAPQPVQLKKAVSGEALAQSLGIAAMDTGTHSHQYAPDAAAIPTREEVLANLAKMKNGGQA